MGLMIVGAVALVLVLACTNLANLTLARGSGRAHDLVVRRALGATRWRLIREHLAESMLIVGGGVVLGALVLNGLLRLLTTEVLISRNLVIQLNPTVSLPVLLLAGSAAVLSVLIVGFWPAWLLTRRDPRPGLAAGSGTTPPPWRGHRSLVSWQVAGSVALLLAAGVFFQFVRTGTADPGVDVDRLALARVNFQTNLRDEDQARRTIADVVEVLGGQPGVEAAAASAGLPFGVNADQRAVTSLDHPFVPHADVGSNAFLVAGTPGLFRTLGVTVVHGRTFADRDTGGSPAVAVISEWLARRVFATTDVVGRQVLVRSYGTLPSGSEPVAETLTIVGVASDTDVFVMGSRDSGVLYRPIAQAFDSNVVFTVRTPGDPARAVRTLRTAMRTVDPGLAPTTIGTGPALLTGPFFFLGFLATLSSLLGTLALVLAMTGLYGVLSHLMARRTREIGVRVALGATRPRIFRLVLSDGFRPVRDGLLLGLLLGLLARFGLRAAFPWAGSPVDLLGFAAVPALFGTGRRPRLLRAGQAGDARGPQRGAPRSVAMTD